MERKVASYSLDEVDAKSWAVCSPESMAGFSAVAYFFGRNLNEKLPVPIGLIDSLVGRHASGRVIGANLASFFAEFLQIANDFTTLVRLIQAKGHAAIGNQFVRIRQPVVQ